MMEILIMGILKNLESGIFNENQANSNLTYVSKYIGFLDITVFLNHGYVSV
jgi:hypothetical protein